MLNELLPRNGATVGSYTVLTMPTRTGEISQTPLFSDVLFYYQEAEQAAPPVQSAGDSQLSGRLQKKLYSCARGSCRISVPMAPAIVGDFLTWSYGGEHGPVGREEQAENSPDRAEASGGSTARRFCRTRPTSDRGGRARAGGGPAVDRGR